MPYSVTLYWQDVERPQVDAAAEEALAAEAALEEEAAQAAAAFGAGKKEDIYNIS